MASSASFDNPGWCVQQLLDHKPSASFEFDVSRGSGMFVVMQACWTDKAKATLDAYSPSELSSKAALWQWFSSLQPHELLKVGIFTCLWAFLPRFLIALYEMQVSAVHDRPWVDLLLKLYRKQQSLGKGDVVFVPALRGEVPNARAPVRTASSGSRARFIVE